jgi:hypothetical protein
MKILRPSETKKTVRLGMMKLRLDQKKMPLLGAMLGIFGGISGFT